MTAGMAAGHEAVGVGNTGNVTKETYVTAEALAYMDVIGASWVEIGARQAFPLLFGRFVSTWEGASRNFNKRLRHAKCNLAMRRFTCGSMWRL